MAAVPGGWIDLTREGFWYASTVGILSFSVMAQSLVNPPYGSSVDVARGEPSQIRTVIRGRGRGHQRSISVYLSQCRRVRWLRRRSHLYQDRLVASTSRIILL